MKNLFLFLFVTGMLIFQHVNAQNPNDETAYIKSLEQNREAKNERFRDPETSPLSDSDVDSFDSLDYFDPDLRYKLDAELELLERPATTKLTTTTGNKKKLKKFGTLSFSLEGKEYTLSVFLDDNLPEFVDNPGLFFVPFTDKTSGETTNTNGRYLAVEFPEEGNTVELDFNRAFNPYSAYNTNYSSILPPPENQLETLVLTGERKYEDR